MLKQNSLTNHSLTAFLYAIPIAILGGLMGLGGAEFRLPVLAGVLGYTARQCVPLNLAVSLVTIIVSLIIRGKTLSLQSLLPWQPIVIFLIVGAVISAFLGATWARKISNEQLEKTILVLLVLIGAALIIEDFLPQTIPALIPSIIGIQVLASLLFGLGIGIVSSMLGVAGGEIIIPTLIFAFGVDIKTAGTGSLIVSLPTVMVGLWRYHHQGAFQEQKPLQQTVFPMAVGSIIGAIIGGLLVGMVSQGFLKLFLGIVLIISAIRVFYHSQHKSNTT
jgi:uncharacterized membrane protein YfcA